MYFTADDEQWYIGPEVNGRVVFAFVSSNREDPREISTTWTISDGHRFAKTRGIKIT